MEVWNTKLEEKVFDFLITVLRKDVQGIQWPLKK